MVHTRFRVGRQLMVAGLLAVVPVIGAPAAALGADEQADGKTLNAGDESSDKRPATGVPRFSLSKEEGGISVYVDGQFFTQYLVRSGTRPVLWPLIGPTGRPMTRSYPVSEALPGEPTDHVHHRSVWFGYEGINELDFWHEPEIDRSRPLEIGTVCHREFTRADSDGKVAVIATRNDWRNLAGKAVCHDERILVFGAGPQQRWIDFLIRLWDAGDGLRIGDSKEGLFALRVAHTMAVDSGLGGRIVNSNGETDADAWGRSAAWVDYHGPVDGETVGIAMMSHPQSFVARPRWHVRTYGLLAANPFGQAPFTGQAESRPDIVPPPNQPIVFHYRILLHVGDEQQAGVAAHFGEWSRGR